VMAVGRPEGTWARKSTMPEPFEGAGASVDNLLLRDLSVPRFEDSHGPGSFFERKKNEKEQVRTLLYRETTNEKILDRLSPQ